MDNKPLTKLKSVAVVIPMYNEEIGIIENLTQITQMLRSYEKTLKVSFAFICVDDGSRDLTPSLVRDFCRHTYGCELISLTRNFGKEGAIEAGLVQANAADAIVVMDCDLQHPPELVESMVKLWQSGIDVVEAVKIDRGVETRSYKRMASLFYQLFGKLSGIDLKDRCDFKLLDAKVVRAYLNLNEKNRFFRGLIQWMGYPTAQIPFVVPERKGGGTRWSVFRLFRLSVTALTAFSSAPLQIVTVLGVVTFIVSVVLGIYSLVLKLLGDALDGFTTVIILLLFIGSVLMFSIGLLGVYMAQIFNELKRRPNYLVNERTSYTISSGQAESQMDRHSVS